jgi:hypothetical protein
MRHLIVLFIHFLTIMARLLGPGGVRSLVAESLLLKHQLLIVNRSRQQSPNLSGWDRILAGLLVLLVRPTRLLRSAIVLKPSTLLALHKSMSNGKYQSKLRSARDTSSQKARSKRAVTLVGIMRGYLLWEVHATQQVREAGVGAQGIDPQVGSEEVGQVGRFLLIGSFQKLESLVLLTQS